MADENLSVLTYRRPTLPVGFPQAFRFLQVVYLAGVGCFLQSHAPQFTDQLWRSLYRTWNIRKIPSQLASVCKHLE